MFLTNSMPAPMRPTFLNSPSCSFLCGPVQCCSVIGEQVSWKQGPFPFESTQAEIWQSGKLIALSHLVSQVMWRGHRGGKQTANRKEYLRYDGGEIYQLLGGKLAQGLSQIRSKHSLPVPLLDMDSFTGTCVVGLFFFPSQICNFLFLKRISPSFHWNRKGKYSALNPKETFTVLFI